MGQRVEAGTGGQAGWQAENRVSYGIQDAV